MRTSFHHQPEAQLTISLERSTLILQLSTSWQADLPHLFVRFRGKPENIWSL